MPARAEAGEQPHHPHDLHQDQSPAQLLAVVAPTERPPTRHDFPGHLRQQGCRHRRGGGLRRKRQGRAGRGNPGGAICSPLARFDVYHVITGDRTTIRKAIVALCSYVQGDLHAGSLTTSVTTVSPKLPRTTLEVPETNFGALHSGGSTQYANSSIPRIDSPQGVTGDVESKDQKQISYRLLCHVNLAGGLIGTKGILIKSFESETGFSIDVGNPFSGCTERVITISALESPGPYSKVQRAMLCSFERMEELERNGRSTFGKPGCSARVLVPKSHFCWLIGLGGAVIKEMVKSTGAGIETDVPACA